VSISAIVGGNVINVFARSSDDDNQGNNDCGGGGNDRQAQLEKACKQGNQGACEELQGGSGSTIHTPNGPTTTVPRFSS
jgi:hypothetical protein